MNKQELYRKYAQLILTSGIDLKPGQNVYLQFEHCHWEFATLLATEAYKMGAAIVDPNCVNQSFIKARIENAAQDSLEFLPEYQKQRFEECSKAPWSRIAIYAPDDPDVFANVDQSRNALVQKASRQAAAPLMKAAGAGKIPWVVCALPTPKWAAKILGVEPSAEAEAKLWEILIPILRLDTPDPIATWKIECATLRRRATKMDSEKFTELHFAAPGTDLRVGMIPITRWEGGSKAANGREFLPNIPTEEVFSSPHYLKTQGRAQITRPVEVFGSTVEGAWFEFENGKVVRCGAKVNEDLLKSFVAADSNAAYLGEVALVDSSSPIFKSGKTFYSILLDENAACHVALGSAYPLGVEDKNLSREELLELGYNQSVVHTDFMIGCPEITVTGIRADGSKTTIIESGTFTAEFR